MRPTGCLGRAVSFCIAFGKAIWYNLGEINLNFLFNEDDIETIHFNGYNDNDLFVEVKEEILKAINEKGNKNE